MENQTEDYQKDQFITVDQLIGRALDRGVVLGADPHQTINAYLQKGLLTQLVNGTFPSTAVGRLVAIDGMLKEGKTIEEIQEFIQKERRNFLQKAVDLNSMVNFYKNTTFRSILMLAFLFVLLVFGIGFVSSNSPSSSLAGGVARSAARPVGQTLAAFIKAAKPEDSNSTDPLGLTNISKVITINEKQQIVMEKTMVMQQPSVDIATNLNADTVDNAHAGTAAGDVLLLDDLGDVTTDGNITIKGIFTGNGSGLTDLTLPSTLLYSDQSYTNPSWLTSLAWSKLTTRPSVVSSIDGVNNDAGNIDLVAGASVTITADDVNNTITFNLAGSGVNADLLDSLDSTQFLRSDTSDSFTSGTLTMAAGTTLDVLGTFTCTNCIGDAAVVNGLTVDATGSINAGSINSSTLGNAGVTLALGSFGNITGSLGDANVDNAITVSNYLPLAGGTMAGNIDFNNHLALNIGNAGTDFTATGGINLADAITFSGDTNLYRSAANVLTTNDSLDVDGQLAVGSNASMGDYGSIYIGDTLTGLDEAGIYLDVSLNQDAGLGNIYGISVAATHISADTHTLIGVDSRISQSGTGALSSLIGLRASLQSTFGGGAITSAYGLLILAPSYLGPTPTTAYGARIYNQGGTTGYGLYIDAQTNYSIYDAGSSQNAFLSTTSMFGRTASGNDSSYRVVIQGSLCVDDSTPSCAAGPTAGAIYVENSVGAGNVSAFDVSEYYPAIEPTEKGDLVSAAGNSAVKKSSIPYDSGLIGIVSTDPAMVIDETNITFGKTAGDNFNPLKPYIALAGRVPVKISTENGAIQPGDPLTSSSTPGVAMKATSSGPIIGKALETFSGPGVGKIVAFVSIGWYVAPLGNGAGAAQQLTNIDVQTLTAGTVNTQVLLVGNTKFSMADDGGLQIDGNVEIAGDLNVTGSITAREVATNELLVSDKSSGTDVVTAGTNELEVKATVVKETSKVLVTFTSDYSPATRFWVSKKTGKSFTVHLDQPPSTNISFDWLVVN